MYIQNTHIHISKNFNLFPNIEEEQELPDSFKRPELAGYQFHTRILFEEGGGGGRGRRKEEEEGGRRKEEGGEEDHKLISLMNIDSKILSGILANQI